MNSLFSTHYSTFSDNDSFQYSDSRSHSVQNIEHFELFPEIANLMF